MSAEALTWAWKINLSSSQKIIVLALANYADQEASCYPGHERLSQMTGMSVRSVGRNLRELEAMGVFTKERRSRKNGSGRTSDRYYLNLAWSGSEQPVDNSPKRGNRTDCPVETNRTDCQVEQRFNRTNDAVSIGQNVQGYIREPIEESIHKRVSEPDDSDVVLEPGVVDEAEETQTRLLDALDDAVEANGFKRPGRTKANQRAMRLLLTKDGYTETQVSWMIGWATDHHFWYKNIRSAEKLRQQFDRLVVEAKEQRGQGPNGGRPMNKAEARLKNNLGVVEYFAEQEQATGNYWGELER